MSHAGSGTAEPRFLIEVFSLRLPCPRRINRWSVRRNVIEPDRLAHLLFRRVPINPVEGMRRIGGVENIAKAQRACADCHPSCNRVKGR